MRHERTDSPKIDVLAYVCSFPTHTHKLSTNTSPSVFPSVLLRKDLTIDDTVGTECGEKLILEQHQKEERHF